MAGSFVLACVQPEYIHPVMAECTIQAVLRLVCTEANGVRNSS